VWVSSPTFDDVELSQNSIIFCSEIDIVWMSGQIPVSSLPAIFVPLFCLFCVLELYPLFYLIKIYNVLFIENKTKTRECL
jgi:hypothetical protein